MGSVGAPFEGGQTRVGRSLITITGAPARAFSSAVVARAVECHSSPSGCGRLPGAGRAAVARTTGNNNERSGRRLENVAFPRENIATETEGRDALAVSRDYDNFEMVSRLVRASALLSRFAL